MRRAPEQNAPYLFRREVHPDDIQKTLNSWAYSFPTAVRTWVQMRERRSLKGVIDGLHHREEGETAYGHALEGVQFAYDLLIEHKKANGLRAGVLSHNLDPDALSVFGLDLTYAMNHRDFTDHAIPHVRRTHRVMDQTILNVPELRHRASIDRWLPALELFPHNHDVDQVLTLMRNKSLKREMTEQGRLDEYDNLQLDSKAAHGLAAAVMTMALSGRYREEAGMSPVDASRAQETANTAALMIMKHEWPEKLDEAFSPTYAGNRLKHQGSHERYSGKRGLGRLLRDFDKNNVDLFSLSPKQVIQILGYKKRAAGFVSDDNTYGLHPSFVKEYRKELDALARDTRPLLPGLSGTDEASTDARETFVLATKVAVFADEVEMIYPPHPSIMRSLKTERSRKRPFWRKGATAEAMLREIEAQGGNYSGDLSSDSYRLLWEAWDMIHKTERAMKRQSEGGGFDLTTAPYVEKVTREHVLMRLFALRDFGVAVLTGESGPVVGQIYGKRKESLMKKALKRSKTLSRLEKQRLQRAGNPHEVAHALMEHDEAQLWDSYQYRLRELDNETAEMINVIEAKPQIGTYDEGDLEQFTELVDRLSGYAAEVFGISETEAQKIREKMTEGADFYKTYDPLGGIPDTIRQPRQYEMWTQLLSGRMRGRDFWELRAGAQRQEELLYRSQGL